MESDAQLVSSEFPIGVRLGSDQETYLATESLSPCSSSEIQQVALDVCLGSLSCWKSARWPRVRSDGSIFSFSIEQYICEFMMPSMKCSSPTPAALMQPYIRTLAPPCSTVGTMHFSLYSSPLRRHTVLKPSVPKTFILVSSLQSIPEYTPSNLHRCQHGPWQTLGGLFCAWALGEPSFVDGTHACHSSAVYAVLCHGK